MRSNGHLYLVLALGIGIDVAETKLVGAFCFPHASITLEPQTRDFRRTPAALPDSKEKCVKMSNVLKLQAQKLISLKPDLILLTSPHGLGVRNSYLFLGNDMVQGGIKSNGRKSSFDATFDIDVDTSILLSNRLRNLNYSTEVLRIGSRNDVLPIRWGEVIPWFFISEAAKAQNFTLPSVIYMGFPSAHRENAQIPELRKLGTDILTILEDNTRLANRRVAVVISSDLSHYHSQAKSSPYKWSPEAVKFDAYIEEWAKIEYSSSTAKEVRNILIGKAGNMSSRIGSCGYRGLVVLHGILEKAVENGQEFDPFFLEYSAPTYFGIMANHWISKI